MALEPALSGKASLDVIHVDHSVKAYLLIEVLNWPVLNKEGFMYS